MVLLDLFWIFVFWSVTLNVVWHICKHYVYATLFVNLSIKRFIVTVAKGFHDLPSWIVVSRHISYLTPTVFCKCVILPFVIYTYTQQYLILRYNAHKLFLLTSSVYVLSIMFSDQIEWTLYQFRLTPHLIFYSTRSGFDYYVEHWYHKHNDEIYNKLLYFRTFR